MEARLRQELQVVVEEYAALERESAAREASLNAGLGAVVALAHAQFAAMRALWGCISTGGGDVATAQRALLSALALQDETARAVEEAGCADAAAKLSATASTPAGGPPLHVDVLSYSTDASVQAEKAHYRRALEDCDAERVRLNGVVAAQAADAAAAAARIAQLQSELDAARAALASERNKWRLGDRSYEPSDVAALASRLDEVQRQLLDATAMRTSSSAQASLMKVMAEESARNLARAADAESQVEEWHAQVTRLTAEREREVKEWTAKVATLESGNQQLARTVTTLRSELELLQQKFTAREGVVDMLRAELGEAHARAARLQANKVDLARKATTALKEVEGQVHLLTAAMSTMKAGGHASGRSSPPPPSAATAAAGGGGR